MAARAMRPPLRACGLVEYANSVTRLSMICLMRSLDFAWSRTSLWGGAGSAGKRGEGKGEWLTVEFV